MPPESAIGIDLGGTQCRFAAVRSDGSLAASEQVRGAAEFGAGDLVRLLVSHVRRLRSHASEVGTSVVGVGFVMPGFLSVDGRCVAEAANLPKLVGSNLPEQLRAACPVPITFDADCHAAGIAEARLGAGRGAERVIVASIGTGIGASVLVNGEVLRFNRNGAGSLGHVIVAPDGPPCRCGRRGCLEAVAAGPAFERDGVDAAARHLAVGVAVWSAVFRPYRVVFCGGVSALGQSLIDAVDRELRGIMPTARPELRVGTLGPNAALVGAGLIALDAAARQSALPQSTGGSTIRR
jgi:glucokinase